MFINQLWKATAYVSTELCISLDKFWRVSWNIIAIIDLSVLGKINDAETSKYIGKCRNQQRHWQKKNIKRKRVWEAQQSKQTWWHNSYLSMNEVNNRSSSSSSSNSCGSSYFTVARSIYRISKWNLLTWKRTLFLEKGLWKSDPRSSSGGSNICSWEI